ncbi:MAG: 5-formyltetrahydrofolate cyclo-ligase [Actinomycetota bacterium]|nr:5-formyltetrahydrofolate cyclo-ligase [Actinomycetota bacterium]
MTTKSEIRELACAARRSIPAEERALRAAAACGRLVGLPEVHDARVVLGYLATTDEIDPARCLKSLGDRGVLVSYPRIAGAGALTIHVPLASDDLESGPHGIRQPYIDAPKVDPDNVDIIIVPGVAFDVTGERVGYGGGYYDRLLPHTSRALRIALAFDEQIVAEIPHEPHDEHVDIVVTPTRVIRADGSQG